MAYDPTTWNHEDVITSQKLNKIEKGLTDVTESAIYGFGGAQQSSDGLTPLSYINAGDPMPSNPKKGDTIFIKDGNDFSIYSYDGEQWNIKIDPNLSQRLSDTLKEAKDSANKAISDNNDQINNTISEVAQEKVDLAIKDADFNDKAQAMADKALQDAKDNTATVAQETLDSANQNIAQAKSDITDAYKTADGVIDKKIDDTASSITTTINQNKTDADGKISSAQSTATQALNEVSTKVSQTDYDTKTGDLDTRVTKAQTTVDGAITTVGNYQTSNDARVKAAETKISQNANDITLRATTTDLNNAKADYNAQIAQVKIDAGKVETTVSNLSDTVDNISIGSRNYLLNSDVSTTSSIESFKSSKTISSFSGEKIVVSVQVDYDNITSVSNQKRIGAEFTVVNATTNATLYLGAWKNPIVGESFHGRIYQSFDFTALNIKGDLSDDLTFGQGIYIQGVNGTNVSISRPKIEIGNKATDWSPAPEDTVNALASQQITIDGITDTVSKQGANIDSVTKRVTTAEGTLTTATDNISGLQTKQTTTANQVTQEIADRKTGDTNTLQSSKDFTTSSITSAVNGVNSTITQTSDSLIAKIDTKTDSDTVLSLLKDNWSIGIQDNQGLLTTGLFGDINGMTLNGKTVTIDANTTNITGTAWINSAMIQNGSIVNADIADATITNAKIATLDVAKITGDVSSFIQSNWNGTYGSTTITSSGMEVKTTSADAIFDANGVTIYTAKGATALRDGGIGYLTSSNEDIGMVGTVKWAPHPNVDYLMIGLHGYHTTTPGDDNYDVISGKNNVVFGGDGIGFGISNANGGYDMLMTWDSPLVAGYQNRISGWHVEDVFSTELMMYANAGIKISSSYSGGTRTLHTQGVDISSSSKWFGWMSGDNTAGFGTDNTQDVIFFMKGKPYSLYTMLGKLGMR